MRIVAYPDKGYYAGELYKCIKHLDCNVIQGEWSGRWIIENVKKDDVVHIHWPSFYYTGNANLIKSIRSFLRFSAILLLLKVRSGSIIWTAHNLLPHERALIPYLDVLGRNLIISSANIIFVHGAEAEKVLLDKFISAKEKCCQIPFGNWKSRYPEGIGKVSAREDLNIPTESFVYLFLGRCRPYKNLEGLIESFLAVAKDTDILLIVGAFIDDQYLDKIKFLASDDSRIIIIPKFVSDEETSIYLSSCDIMCLPYNEILTSGSAMLALSFGRPVISINKGFLKDIILPNVGLLMEKSDSQSINKCLKEARTMTWSESEILDYADNFQFSSAAKIMIQELKKL